jgi:serine/threonine protein kinase
MPALAPTGARDTANEDCDDFNTRTFVGTAAFMSPERINGREYSFPSDVWALGLSLMTVALGRLPVDTKGGYWSILHSIRDDALPALPDHFSSHFQDFLDRCLSRNPSERWKIDDLRHHPWLSQTAMKSLSTTKPRESDETESLRGYDHESRTMELKAILAAVQVHVQQRITAEHPPQEAGTATVEEAVVGLLHQTMLGDLGQLDGSLDMAALRFCTLARQLYLPVETVLAEVTHFLGAEYVVIKP